MLTRIYPRSLGLTRHEIYHLPGNQKRCAFADLHERKLELGLNTLPITTNSFEMPRTVAVSCQSR